MAGESPSPAATTGAFYGRVYEVVGRIPPGRVTTYGTVSQLVVGHARAARTVGWALHSLSPRLAAEVPWWRVINAQGRISTSCETHTADEQRARLAAEGVAVDGELRVDLKRYGWFGE